MLNQIEAIINSLAVNISIIFSAILLMYFTIIRRIITHAPIKLKHFNNMKMTRRTRINAGIIFAFTCYFISNNGIQIDAIQKVDTRYLFIYFVMYYASTMSGLICGSLFMVIKSLMILTHGYPIISVPFIHNFVFTSLTMLIAYLCTRNKRHTWRNHLVFLASLFIIRAILLTLYIPYVELDGWSPNLLSYTLMTSGCFLLVNHLIARTTQLINDVITYKVYSQIDPLTHLFNRSALAEHFNEMMNTSASLAKKQGTSDKLSLCFIDLDSFKEINDTYGHSIGDKILHEFTDLMRTHFDTNYQYRYGGDEFVLIFFSEAEQVAQQTKKFILLIQQHTFLSEIAPMRLSISIGIAEGSLGSDETNLQELLSDADSALYVAKLNGKNQQAIYQKK